MDGELDSTHGNKDNSSKGSSPTVFTCRFCSRKFFKSQGLGGHMNGHRQERDNENYKKAKELVEQKGGSNSWMVNNQYVAPQNYSSIPEGMKTHVEQSGPSQVQTWAQAGGHGHGHGPTSYLNQQQQEQDFSPYLNQQKHKWQQGFAPPNLGNHTDYQMRETYPSHPDFQIRETYPSLPYKTSHNLQMVGGGESLMNNSVLPMNNHFQITGPSFPSPQGENSNHVTNGYATPSTSEQQFPTSQGGNPNAHLGMNGDVAASTSEQQHHYFNGDPLYHQLWQGNNPY